MDYLFEKRPYQPAWWLKFGHINTIYSAMSRKVNGVTYDRERFELQDGDFIDLDWSRVAGPSRKLVVVMHGLEGNAGRPYVKGMARYFNQHNWHAMGLNFRGCSGTPNRRLQSYHMSKIDDVAELMTELESRREFDTIVLVGFSLGGNVLLNYLARMDKELPSTLKGGVAISVPVDLVPSIDEIASLKNKAYVIRFLNTLNPKMKDKLAQFPNEMQAPKVWPKTLGAFDDFFTSRIHGFKNAKDYWEKSSVFKYLPDIDRPCLLINAQDDSFLSPGCFSKDLASISENFHVCLPKYGGHCGFAGQTNENGVLWSEQITYDFVKKYIEESK